MKAGIASSFFNFAFSESDRLIRFLGWNLILDRLKIKTDFIQLERVGRNASVPGQIVH